MFDDDASTAKVLLLEQPVSPAPDVGLAPRIGKLVVDGERLLVDFAGNSAGPLTPRWLTSVAHTNEAGAELLLVFDRGQLDQPIVVGRIAPTCPKPIDDTRVLIDGRDEVALQCGKASLVLRRNGRVVISGTLVEARSSGRTRILGTTVEIN